MIGQQYNEFQVRLHRNTLNTPWGFRLQGGREYQTPLTVQRVFAGSAADGELHRGDIIVAIDNKDVSSLTQRQTQDIIKQKSRDFMLRIRRGGVPNKPQQNMYYMPHKAQEPVNYNQHHYKDEEELYEPKPVSEIRQMFSHPQYSKRAINKLHSGAQYIPKRPAMKKTVSNAYTPLADLGWTATPKHMKGPPNPPSNDRFYPKTPPVNKPQNCRHVSPVREKDYSRPAWMGSLRSYGGPKLWSEQENEHHDYPSPERPSTYSNPPSPSKSHPSPYNEDYEPHNPNVQHMHFGPSGSKMYQQHKPGTYESETAKVKHLQYNSPIGLYSQENAAAVLERQTQGKPGYGSMHVSGSPTGKKTFNPARSDICKMVLAEDERKHFGEIAPAHGGTSSPARQYHSPTAQVPPPQRMETMDQHSSRFHQLVHMDDQQQQLFEEHRHPYGHYSGVEAQFENLGFSDF